MVATTSKPAFASSSDTPLTSTTSLVAERTRKLDEGFAHRGLVADTVVDFGGVLTVV